MADLYFIDVCFECLTPVERCRRCPVCGGNLKRICSFGFETMMILSNKGYKPISCRLLGYGRNKGVMLVFSGHSPGCGVHGEMKMQLDEENLAVCSTWKHNRDSTAAYRKAYEWSQEAMELKSALPFNRKLCSKCGPQHDVEWLHGVCQCPSAGLLGSDKHGATGPHEFGSGLPKACFYLAEQVMTRHEVARTFGVELNR